MIWLPVIVEIINKLDEIYRYIILQKGRLNMCFKSECCNAYQRLNERINCLTQIRQESWCSTESRNKLWDIIIELKKIQGDK